MNLNQKTITIKNLSETEKMKIFQIIYENKHKKINPNGGEIRQYLLNWLRLQTNIFTYYAITNIDNAYNYVFKTVSPEKDLNNFINTCKDYLTTHMSELAIVNLPFEITPDFIQDNVYKAKKYIINFENKYIYNRKDNSNFNAQKCGEV